MILPPTKRAKTSQNDVDDDIYFSQEVIDQPERFKEEFLSSAGKPFSHNIISNICPDEFLTQVLDEIKQNTKVNFKESDLFKFYQSIDLANVNEREHGGIMPCLLKLKQSLYSAKFRNFVEKICNLEENTLTEKVDCAANCHTTGCHLLCHDDVIGTRKVSFIIYLTDPKIDWTAKHGGQLELYGSNSGEKQDVRLQPDTVPMKTILPTFNSMAYFVVEPGESFHSVQEVFGDSPRLSIQGWYHAEDLPRNIHNATLSRLKSTEKGEDTEDPFVAIEDEEGSQESGGSSNECPSLTEAEFTDLKKYINETYLKPESMEEIRKRFEEESSVQLRHFLTKEWEEVIKVSSAKEDHDDKLGSGLPALDYNVGENECWKILGPSHKQRFLEYNRNCEERKEDEEQNAKDVGMLLQQLKEKLFQSKTFSKFLMSITSLCRPTGCRGRVRRFRPGLDYTVAHYGILTTSAVLDATLCFVAGNGNQCMYDEQFGDLIGDDADAVWESGDVGGFECYISAEDEDEDEEIAQKDADDEYNAESDTELLSVSASNNTLSLVYRDPGTMRFVKYVASNAPSSRWDVSIEYEVPDDNEIVHSPEESG